jgi:hypothetical protein
MRCCLICWPCLICCSNKGHLPIEWLQHGRSESKGA